MNENYTEFLFLEGFVQLRHFSKINCTEKLSVEPRVNVNNKVKDVLKKCLGIEKERFRAV